MFVINVPTITDYSIQLLVMFLPIPTNTQDSVKK